MPDFIYRVVDETGRTFSALTEAQDIKNLKTVLRNNGWSIAAIHPVQLRDGRAPLRKKIGLDDLIMFTHQLGSMLDAGLPILRAIEILWKQVENEEFQIVISQIKNKLSQGASIRDAFGHFPDVFPPLYLSLLSVAEMGGNLVIILQNLTNYLSGQRDFISKVKKATTYPTIVVGFSFVVVTLMLVWVVPTFQTVFAKIKVELPLFTKIIINISTGMRQPAFWITAAAVAAGGYFFLKKYAASPLGRERIDRLKLKIPILGPIVYYAAISRVARSLSLLVSGGLPLAQSIDVVKETTLNTKISKAMEWVKKRVEEGAPLGIALIETAAFPSFMVEMISVGEESGTLVEMLDKIAVHFEEEFDFRLTRFLTVLEPLLIIFVGGLVVFVLLSIYLPIFRLWSGISGAPR